MKYKRKYEFFVPERPEYGKAEILDIKAGINSVSFSIRYEEQNPLCERINLMRPFGDGEYWAMNDYSFIGFTTDAINHVEDNVSSLYSNTEMECRDARFMARTIQIMSKEYLSHTDRIRKTKIHE